MTMDQLQKRLARIVKDLGAVEEGMYERGLREDWRRINDAMGLVGVVCLGFLDERALNALPESVEIYNCVRPEAVSRIEAEAA